METFEAVSAATALRYAWGSTCDGWHLVQHPSLSVIQERMPPGTAEDRHAHVRARQFFFVLSGSAVLEAAGVEHKLGARQGLEVAPGVPHQIFNRSSDTLELLVISVPPSHGDRVL